MIGPHMGGVQRPRPMTTNLLKRFDDHDALLGFERDGWVLELLA
jgi:hypothetical protein